MNSLIYLVNNFGIRLHCEVVNSDINIEKYILNKIRGVNEAAHNI